jgi:hypothetical protein
VTAAFWPQTYWYGDTVWVSPPMPTTGSVSTRIRAAALIRLQAITLPDVDPSNIVSLKLPLDRVFKAKDAPVTLPCILLTPQRQQMPPEKGTTSQDDVFYPMLATLCSVDNQEATLQANLDRQELWIERIARAFRSQRLSDVPEVVIVTVEPFDTIDQRAWGQNLLVSAILLRFHTREPRGLNV